MKKSEVAELVMMLLAAYPNARTSSATSQVYEAMLADLDAGQARAAVQRLIAASRFMPTVAEIRAAVAALEHGAVRSGAEAWLDVLDQIRREGYCGTPRFADPLVEAIVTRWGWRTLCLSGDDAADRARFCEAYDAMAKREREGVVGTVALPEPQAAPRPQLRAVEGSPGPAPVVDLRGRA